MKNCKLCGEVFKVVRTTKRFCSRECARAFRTGKPLFYPELECVVCEKKFQTVRRGHHCCSKKCCAVAHYRRRIGKPIKGIRRVHKGFYIGKKGYTILFLPNHPQSRKDGSIFQHVVIMSEFLGRPLVKGENVHHKNGIRHDNRIENLELWSTGQPPGQRVTDKLKWAKEFLESYGCTVLKSEQVFDRLITVR